MSSNNRPWKEVNLIRRYEEKNLNRLSKQDMEELDEGVIQNVTNAIGNLKTKVVDNQAARATKKADAAQQKATAAQQKADNTFISNFGKQVDNLEATYNPNTPQKWLATAIKNDSPNGTFKSKVGELSAVAISNGIENLVNNSNNKGQINGARVDEILNKVNSLSTNQVYGEGSFKPLIDKINKFKSTPASEANGTPDQPASVDNGANGTPDKPAQPATETVNKTPEQPEQTNTSGPSKDAEVKAEESSSQTEKESVPDNNDDSKEGPYSDEFAKYKDTPKKSGYYGEDFDKKLNQSLHRKNPNRLKESRDLNILSIELKDKVVCPDRYYDDVACETFSSYKDFEEICKDYRDSVEPDDYEYDDMELIIPKAVISYLEDGVKKSDRVSLGISVIVNNAIGVKIDNYLEVFFNNSFNGETIRVGKDNIESLLNTGVLKLNKDIKEKKNKKGDKMIGSKSWKDDNLIKKIRESSSESTIVLRVDALGKARALKVAERINSILERNSLVDGEYTVNDMDGESGIYEVFFSSPVGDLDTLVDEVSSVLRDTPVSKFLVGNLHEASNDMDAVDFEI